MSVLRTRTGRAPGLAGYVHAFMSSVCVFISLYMQMCICLCISVYVCMSVCVCDYLFVYLSTYNCLYVFVYICKHNICFSSPICENNNEMKH